MRHLTDLDELLQNIRNAYVREYMTEAVTAYRAGAYKAAVATTWVAVCIDIIEKIRELSASGDKAAEKFEAELEAIDASDVKGMLEFEGRLLEIAADELEFISFIEMKQFERLKEDRNICVHPSFQKDGRHYDVSAELTLSHMVQACSILLTQVPTKGKVLINQIFDKINEGSFPKDDENAFTMLSSNNYLGKARQSVFRNLSIILLKRLFNDEDGMPVELLARITCAINAIERLNQPVLTAVLNEKLNVFLAAAPEKTFQRVFFFLFFSPNKWDLIEEAQQIRMKNLITSMSVANINKRGVPLAVSKITQLREVMAEKVDGLDTSEKKEILTKFPREHFKSIAIDIFVKSGSFNSAFSNGMEILVPHAKYFNDEDLEAIHKGSMSNGERKGINQVMHAGGIDAVFKDLYIQSKDNVLDPSSVWLSFRNEAKEAGFDFEELDEALVADEILELGETDAVDLDEEIPF